MAPRAACARGTPNPVIGHTIWGRGRTRALALTSRRPRRRAGVRGPLAATRVAGAGRMAPGKRRIGWGIPACNAEAPRRSTRRSPDCRIERKTSGDERMSIQAGVRPAGERFRVSVMPRRESDRSVRRVALAGDSRAHLIDWRTIDGEWLTNCGLLVERDALIVERPTTMPLCVHCAAVEGIEEGS